MMPRAWLRLAAFLASCLASPPESIWLAYAHNNFPQRSQRFPTNPTLYSSCGGLLFQVRGGASYDDSQSSNQHTLPVQQGYANDEGSSGALRPSYDNSQTNPYDMQDMATPKEVPFSETVQEQVERWKTQQREQALLSAQNIPNQGSESTSILRTVSKGSRVIVFFLLMWRDIHLYEMADQSVKNGALRVFLVTPLVFLFVANLLGGLASMGQSQGHGTKRRLKAVLNADKMVEVILMTVGALRLTILPSKKVSQDVILANVFHSIIFFIQCQLFTRGSWDDKQPPPELNKLSTTAEEVEDTMDNLNYQQQHPYPDSRYQPYRHQQNDRNY